MELVLNFVSGARERFLGWVGGWGFGRDRGREEARNNGNEMNADDAFFFVCVLGWVGTDLEVICRRRGG